jgi:hypothetical protein
MISSMKHLHTEQLIIAIYRDPDKLRSLYLVEAMLACSLKQQLRDCKDMTTTKNITLELWFS